MSRFDVGFNPFGTQDTFTVYYIWSIHLSVFCNLTQRTAVMTISSKHDISLGFEVPDLESYFEHVSLC